MSNLNIYSPQANLSSIDVIADDTVNRVLNPKL